MRMITILLGSVLLLSACGRQNPTASADHDPAGTGYSTTTGGSATAGGSATIGGSASDRQQLLQTTAAIRGAFARGDVDAIVALHHPNIVKYFGGTNVVKGREALRKGLTGWLNATRVEFVENTVESTVFNGETAIETCIFSIRNIPKNGDSVNDVRGRSMVVYVRYQGSPTGWASLREITQEAPPK